MSRGSKLGIVILAIALAIGAGWAFASNVLTTQAPVTAVSSTAPSSTSTSSTIVSSSQTVSAVIESATIGGATCTVSTDQQSATCPGTTTYVGNGEEISIVVQNGPAAIAVAVSAQSSNTASWAVTADSNNPTNIPAGGSATFVFFANAIAGGTSTISISIAY